MKTKREILCDLRKRIAEDPYWSDDTRHSHPFHWYIKMHGQRYDDFMGLDNPDYPNNIRFNDRWNDWLEKHDVFFDICEMLLRPLLDDKPWFFDGTPLEGIAYVMYQSGRTGGHLVLESFGGEPMYVTGEHVFIVNKRVRFANDEDSFLGYLAREHNVAWFRALQQFLQMIDEFVDNRYKLMAEEYAYIRHETEREWLEDEQNDRELAAGQVGPMLASPVLDSVA